MKLISVVALLGLCAVAVNSQLAAAPGLGPGVGGVPGLPFLPPVVPGVIGLPAFRPLFGARRALLWSLGAFPFGFFGPFIGKRDVESKFDFENTISDFRYLIVITITRCEHAS